MKILWFTWKDQKNPDSGGAELVNEELAKRLVKNGHQVIFLVAGFKDCKNEETVNDYKIIRLGNKWTVYWHAYKYFKKNLKNWPDLIIEEINTVPFFTKFYTHKRNILFVHQLCREIWYYQIFFPINFIGYVIEPFYLWLFRNQKVITISHSTKKDLLKYGFSPKNIFIISEGIDLSPVVNLDTSQKYPNPTLLSLGQIRPMKRTTHIIKAFELAKKEIPKLQLMIAGDAGTKYGEKTLRLIKMSEYFESIKYLGVINKNKKIKLLQKSHLIIVTSIKEGWGLIITEANSQGTPAIVYDVDGLRDAVQNYTTGIICQRNHPNNIAKNIIQLLNNQDEYRKLQINAWQFSKKINFQNCFRDFINVLNQL